MGRGCCILNSLSAEKEDKEVKEKIHPDYDKVKYECACGNLIETQSTRKGVVKLDICSACHPFFTGKEKLVDTAGRVERFYRKYGRDVEVGKKKKNPKGS